MSSIRIRQICKASSGQRTFFQKFDEGKPCKELADLYFPSEPSFKACMRKLKAKMRRGLKNCVESNTKRIIVLYKYTNVI